MSFLDKVKGMFNVADEDYYDDIPERGEFEQSTADIDNDMRSNTVPFRSADPLAESEPKPQTRTPRQSHKMATINTTTQIQVVLVKPDKFEDASSIADHLNSKRTVILNLESASRDTSRRLVDFLSGVAYANDGQLKRVANSTFMITPFNVDIMGDVLIDELESSGLYL